MSDYPIDLSGNGFNKFAEFYKVPTAFLAIGLTLVGLCAANHRSEQTKRQIERTANQITLTNSQIELTKIQNNFSNYYKHIEEFEKYCKDHKDYDTYVPEPRKLHRLIFSKSNSASAIFIIDDEFTRKLDSFILLIFNLANGFEGDDLRLRYDNAYKINSVNNEFQESTFLKVLHGPTGGISGRQITSSQGNFILESGSWRVFFSKFQLLIKVIDTILRFDQKYEQSPIVNSALQIDLSSIPGSDNINKRFNLAISPLTKSEISH